MVRNFPAKTGAMRPREHSPRCAHRGHADGAAVLALLVALSIRGEGPVARSELGGAGGTARGDGGAGVRPAAPAAGRSRPRPSVLSGGGGAAPAAGSAARAAHDAALQARAPAASARAARAAEPEPALRTPTRHARAPLRRPPPARRPSRRPTRCAEKVRGRGAPAPKQTVRKKRVPTLPGSAAGAALRRAGPERPRARGPVAPLRADPDAPQRPAPVVLRRVPPLAAVAPLLPPVSSASPDAREVRHRMALATPQYSEKTDDQKAITEMVRQFVDEQILPKAEHYDHEDEFPEPIVEQMKELGLFGVTIPEEYGGMGLDLTTYAMIVEELSRGWISISGVVNTHFIGSYLLMKFGTDEQKERLLPKMATGEIRAAFSLSEPELGSDVQAIKSTGAQDRRRRLRAQRPEDVGHQRPALRPGLRADEDRQGCRSAAPRDDLLRVREGAGRLREPGPQRPAPDQEDGLQGRRVDRARLRRLPLPGRHDPRRRGGRPRARASRR